MLFKTVITESISQNKLRVLKESYSNTFSPNSTTLGKNEASVGNRLKQVI